jgi:hypothetical protein
MQVDSVQDASPSSTLNSRLGGLGRAAASRIRRAVDGVLRRDGDDPMYRRQMSELLEPRKLLTTLSTGDTFFYSSFDYDQLPEDADDFVPVELFVGGFGDAEVQALGATADGELTELSGVIIRADGTRELVRGGLGGRAGSFPIISDELLFPLEVGGGLQPYSVADVIGYFGENVRAAPQEVAMQVDVVATNDDGLTYGLQLIDDDNFGGPRLDLFQFNTDFTDFDFSALGTGVGLPNRDPGAASTDLATLTNVGDALFRDDILPTLVDTANNIDGGTGDFDDLLNPLRLDSAADPLTLESIENIFGADFVPGGANQNELIIGATVTTLREEEPDDMGMVTTGETEVPVFFSYNILFGTAEILATDLSGANKSDEAGGQATIDAFAIGPGDEYFLYGTFREGGEDGAETVGLLSSPNISGAVTFGAAVPGGVVDIQLFGETIDGLNSLEYYPPTDEIFGLVGEGDEIAVVAIDANFSNENNNARQVGGVLGDTDNDEDDDNDDPVRGENVSGLSFDPTSFNPLLDNGNATVEPEENGVLFSFDSGTDELLNIDPRNRGVSGGLSLYTLVVQNADDSTTISVQPIEFNEDNVTVETSDDLDDETEIFDRLGVTGDAGTIAFFDDDAVNLPGGTGELFLGLKFQPEQEDGEDPSITTIGSIDPAEFVQATPAFAGPLTGGLIVPGLYTVDSSLGGFYFAGTVTGQVRVEGALGEFFAGSILTGDSTGGFANNTDNFAVYGEVGNIISLGSIGDNQVGGALDFVPDGLPDSVAFSSNADFAIGGRVNAIRSFGSITGSYEILGEREPPDGFIAPTFFKSLDDTYEEFEFKIVNEDNNVGNSFKIGNVVVGQFVNDSFETYEPVGTQPDGSVTISGGIDSIPDPVGARDYVDYYGIGLMAGETIVVELEFGLVAIGIFDPDGRLVATNYEDNLETGILRVNEPFQFTPETAGTYRFAVGFRGAPSFSASPPEDENVRSSAAYQLTLSDVGDITLGGMVAGQRVFAGQTLGTDFRSKANVDLGSSDTLRVRQGDIGIVEARNDTILTDGVEAFLQDNAAPGVIRTISGHIRSVSGSSLGEVGLFGDLSTTGINLRAAFSIGRLEATGVAGGAFGGDILLDLGDATQSLDGRVLTEVSAGDDIQVVTAARDILGNFVVGRGIGSISAERDFTDPAGGRQGSIIVNVDDINDDGFVDLLSVGRNVGYTLLDDGTFAIPGGPAIDVGTGGNFRYFDVSETLELVRDPFFGRFQSDLYQDVPAGESFDYTDDSGTRVRVSTSPGTPDDFDPTLVTGQGQLQVLTYPVRSGGSILVNARTNASFEVETLDRGDRGTAEVGNVFLAGDNGRRVEFGFDPNDGFDGTPADPEDPFSIQRPVRFGLVQDDPTLLGDPTVGVSEFDDVEVRMRGRNVDIFGINTSELGGDGRVTEIVNETGGSIINTRLGSIGLLRAERVGVSQPRGFAELRPANLGDVAEANTFPFDREPYLIAVEGSIAEIEADAVGHVFAGADLGIGGIGDATPDPLAIDPGLASAAGDGLNLSSVALVGEPRGVIGSIVADSYGGDRFESDTFGSGRDDPNVFEGIVGPIVARSPSGTSLGGQIRFVDVGEGIASDGNGNSSGGGLYADSFILSVVANDNANIYGDITSTEINSIVLNGGSLIGADITQVEIPVEGGTAGNIDFSLNREFPTEATVLVEENDTEGAPIFEIDEVVLNGGGIIGSRISAADVDSIRVNDGFGILRSQISADLSDSVINSVVVDGLGIRNSSIVSGLNVNEVIANGDGEPIDISEFDPTLLRSESSQNVFDPTTGKVIGAANDLRVSLGLPDNVDERLIITNSGVFENLTVTAARDIDLYRGAESRSNVNSIFFERGDEGTDSGIGGGNPALDTFGNRIAAGRNITLIEVGLINGFNSTSGELALLDVEEDLQNGLIRTAGRIEQADVDGEIGDLTLLRAEGPDGSIGVVNAGSSFGTIRADIGIDEVNVAGDLGGPLTQLPDAFDAGNATIRAGGFSSGGSPIGLISVGGDVLSGVYIRASDVIDELLIDGDFEDGALVEARRINELDIDGANRGQFILN